MSPPVSSRKCRAREVAYRTLKLTDIEGGIRVDYEPVAKGEATWTNMNSELVRKFKITPGGTFCLARERATRAMANYDYD